MDCSVVRIRNVCLAVLASLFFGLLAGHFYYYTTGDFRLDYLLKASTADADPMTDEGKWAASILNQPFTYLAQGHQTFVFLSRDGQYVLKLFKKDYLNRSGILHLLPPVPPFRSFLLHQGAARESRRKKLLSGYETAYAYDRENCGLCYYHPRRVEKGDFRVVFDSEVQDLNDYVFAIQVKAVTTKQELSRLISLQNKEAVKVRLAELIDLYVSEYRRGIYDKDHNVFDNTGFYKEKAVRQDAGKIVRDPFGMTEEFMRSDLGKIIDQRLGPWLRTHDPAHASELFDYLKDLCRSRLK